MLPNVVPAPHLQPLSEMPALTLAHVTDELRGTEIRDDDGPVLGVVVDLLADPDRLVAEHLIVRRADGAGMLLVPLAAVSKRGAHLAVGAGMPPLELRYRSTIGLTLRIAAAAAVLVLFWALTAFAC
jgi:hypothetical protein